MMIRSLTAASLALLLAGCGTLEMLENRVTCSMDRKQAFYISLYGPLGIASKVAARDGEVICSPTPPKATP